MITTEADMELESRTLRAVKAELERMQKRLEAIGVLMNLLFQLENVKNDLLEAETTPERWSKV